MVTPAHRLSAIAARPLLRHAHAGWAAIALLCIWLPAPVQAQWGLLASSWFWALLALLGWRLRRQSEPRRPRPRPHRGATPWRGQRIHAHQRNWTSTRTSTACATISSSAQSSPPSPQSMRFSRALPRRRLPSSLSA